MLCPNCETANRDGAKFCDECGFPLTGAIAARAAEAASFEAASTSDDNLECEQSFVEGATEVLEAVEDESDQEHEDSPDVADDVIQDEQVAEGGLEDEEPADPPVEAEAESDEEASEEAADTIEDAGTKAVPAGPDITVALGDKLAGLDIIEDEYGERLAGPDFEVPKANWRDGHTMQMPKIEGEEAPRSKDFLASSTVKQNNGKKIAAGIITAIVILAAIAAFATYQMQLWGGKVVPDVRGMTEADATNVLRDSGFEARSTKVKSDDTEGLVLIMDPNEGSRAEEGTEIVIHIATAREIPEVIGKTEEEAKAQFAESGYENVTYEKERSDSTEGTVLSVSPEVGTRAKSSIPVVVKVAEPYVVPDSSSLDLDGTIAAIQDAGLSYYISYYDTTDYVEGTVLGTDPAAGTKVQSSTVVAITVARARGAQLTQLTKDLITPGYELSIDGTNYIVTSLGGVEYLGNDQVSFTATARPYTYFFGVYVEGDAQQVSGVVNWTADNQVAGIS